MNVSEDTKVELVPCVSLCSTLAKIMLIGTLYFLINTLQGLGSLFLKKILMGYKADQRLRDICIKRVY